MSAVPTDRQAVTVLCVITRSDSDEVIKGLEIESEESMELEV